MIRSRFDRSGLRRRCDAGASLVMVMLLLVFTGLVVAAVMKLAETSLDSAVAANDRARLAYDVDGALEAAINHTRNSTFNNDVGQPCPPLNFPGPNSGQPVAVTCQGGLGTGAFGRVPVSADNRPPTALMTLGDNAEIGVHQTGSSNTSSLRVDGGVASNSTITASPGSLFVSRGQATARGACNGTITSTPAADCDTGKAVADPAGAAPSDYAQPTAGLTYRTVPTCPAAAGATVKFLPGYYDDAVGLTNLMSTCTGRTFWFQPAAGGGAGVYYFDFHNGESPVFQGSPVWSITNADTRVVAGTPPSSGPGRWNPDAAGREVPPSPGACVAPTDSPTNNGIEFVFGGRSQLSITAGQLELCGQYYADKPPIGIYGAKSGDDETKTSGGLTLTTTADDPACSQQFNSPGKAKYVDNDSAVSPPLNEHSRTACLKLAGFAPSSAVPPGSILTNATLLVDHAESRDPQTLEATITANPSRAGAVALEPIKIDPYVSNGNHTRTDAIDVTSALFDEVHQHGYAGADVRYVIEKKAKKEGGQNLVARLDALQLNLAWKPPGVRAQDAAIAGFTDSGTRTVTGSVQTSASTSADIDYSATGSTVSATNCVGKSPYEGAGACAAVDVSGTQSSLYVQGTGYAPLAAFRLAQSDVSSPVFLAGLVIRKLAADMDGRADYPGPMIMNLPDTPGGQPVRVYFLAYVCPDGADCTEPAAGAWQLEDPWLLRGTASASYTDDTADPVAGSRAVDVLTWELLS